MFRWNDSEEATGEGDLVSAQHDATEQDQALLNATLDSLLDPHLRCAAVRDEGNQIVDFVYTYANLAACETFEKTYEELIGTRMDLPDRSGSHLLEMYREVIETGEPVVRDDYVYPVEARGGKERHFDIRIVHVAGDTLASTWRDVSDQHLADLRLRALYDSLIDPHVLYEAIRDETGEIVDFRFVDANPAACEYNQWPRERLVGSTLLEQWPDFANDPTRVAYRQVLATGEPVMLDDVAWAQQRLYGGRLRHYDLRAVKVTDSLLSVTWRDITERHEAAETTQHMAAIVEQSQDAIIGSSVPGGVVTSWNLAAERMYGYSAQEVVGKPAWFLVPEDQLAESMARLEQLEADGGSLADSETLHLRKDGTRVQVSVGVSPIRDPNGVVVALSTIHRDITRQREVLELSRSMIEASLDSMVSIGPDGRIADANTATVRLTGLPRDQLIGTFFSDYFTEPARAEEGYQQVLEQGAVSDFPLTMRHRDTLGTTTDVLYNASVYRDTAGTVRGVFATARDVTRQVQAQKDLVEQQARELDRLAELERFQRMTIGRELKMIELKKEIELLQRYGPAAGDQSDPD